MTDQTTTCRHCKKTIPEGADICFRCKRSQGYFAAKLESVAVFISIGSMILSVALVSLSWLQFREASKQRNSAEKAFNSATSALKEASMALEGTHEALLKAENAKNSAEQAQNETQKTVEYLRSNIRLLLEIDQLTPTLIGSDYNVVKVKKIRNKLEKFAVPSGKERKAWLKSIQ